MILYLVYYTDFIMYTAKWSKTCLSHEPNTEIHAMMQIHINRSLSQTGNQTKWIRSYTRQGGDKSDERGIAQSPSGLILLWIVLYS